MRYGAPYMGSKNRIAELVVDMIPRCECLVDLFAGGGAISHCAVLSGKFGRVVANDIGDGLKLFENAINGKYANETHVPNREEFIALKDIDPYVKYCYSFGNNGTAYLWGKEIEDFKILASQMLLYPTIEGRYSAWKRLMKSIAVFGSTSNLFLENSERLQNVERLQSLRNLQELQSNNLSQILQFSYLDYRDVRLPENCVVYCDIPYKGTAEYGDSGFDHAAFYAWLNTVDRMVIISEYTQPPYTIEIAAKNIAKLMGINTKSEQAEEKLFVNERFYDRWIASGGGMF